jgi:penicillin-binding protein 1A
MGVRQSKLDPVMSLALGTSPVTLREMVAAYGTIANGGHYFEPVMVLSVEDRNGTVLEEFAPVRESQPAMPRPEALQLVNAMRGVVDEGTGVAIRQRYGITADVAGKTGTTQENTDGWFILMHPQLVAGAWVGFNDSRVTMRSDYWGQGGHNAILLVGDFFRSVTKGRLVDTKAGFPPPTHPAPPPAPAASEPASGMSIDDAALPAVPRAPASDRASPKTSEELDRALQGMSRESTGGTLGSGTGTSPGGSAPAPNEGAIGQ